MSAETPAEPAERPAGPPGGPPAGTPARHRLFQQRWPAGDYRFFQLGFVVDDLVAAAERWAVVFGVGPFHVMPRVQANCTYRGHASMLDIRFAVAQAGPVQFELIQEHSSRESVFTALAGNRASFHQLCTVAVDYEGTTAHYQRLGYEVACEIVVPDQRVAYVDTTADFGFYTEIAESTPKFVAALATISRTCAEWDGTDPVRLITRDGYRVP
jgi:hypothetical protein